MPLITPSYLYTFVALLAVSSLLVFSFMAYSGNIRYSSEARQLRNLMSTVAAKSTELLTLILTTNASVEAYIEMPASIGSQQYWIQLQNNSARAWLGGGFGNVPAKGSDLRVYLLKETFATGYYAAGHGPAKLVCHSIDNVPNIQLTAFNEGN
jgi:hypothetical protein